jgi:hypothetical protein
VQKPFFFSASEKFKLLGGWRPVHFLLAPEKFHQPELFVGKGEYYDLSFGRKKGFYPSYMDVCIFAAAAMPHINAVLHHGETVLEQSFPEQGVLSPVFFGVGRQIKKNKYPQDPVLV